MSINIKKLAVNIAIPLLVGAISAFISQSGMEAFNQMNKPPFSPPAILFPVVWTILFILMGISAYIISSSKKDSAVIDNALTLYAVQLGVNFFWSIFFFRFGWYFFSFAWLLLLWGLILAVIIYFYKISKLAAYLLIPYIIWVTFAGYLNISIAFLN